MRLALALGLIGAATRAMAEGLEGRDVTMGGLAYEDEAAPIFVGQRWPARVGPGWEYGLTQEGPQNGWDLIPVAIDISANRITLTYPDVPPGEFPEIAFNGYVLDFLTECVLFEGAALDEANSTVEFAEDDIFTKAAQLYIDVGGQPYGPDVIISVLVEVADCPLG